MNVVKPEICANKFISLKEELPEKLKIQEKMQTALNCYGVLMLPENRKKSVPKLSVLTLLEKLKIQEKMQKAPTAVV